MGGRIVKARTRGGSLAINSPQARPIPRAFSARAPALRAAAVRTGRRCAPAPFSCEAQIMVPRAGSPPEEGVSPGIYKSLCFRVQSTENSRGTRMKEHFVNWGPPPLVRLPIHCMLARALTNGMGRRSNDALVPAASESSQKQSPRRSAVVVTASSVAPRAPLPSEAAAESSGHAVPCVWQALQALHSGLVASARLSHVPVGQHASHVGVDDT